LGLCAAENVQLPVIQETDLVPVNGLVCVDVEALEQRRNVALEVVVAHRFPELLLAQSSGLICVQDLERRHDTTKLLLGPAAKLRQCFPSLMVDVVNRDVATGANIQSQPSSAQITAEANPL
jgi:hypothetical protein